MVTWDEEADKMKWEGMDSETRTMTARFPPDGVMSGATTRKDFGAGLVSEIYFEC